MKNSAIKTLLTGVPETMLLTLYNRAYEAKRSDGILHDPEAVRIYEMLDFDFKNYFGSKPLGGTASRAFCFDEIIIEWLKVYPDGQVVSLGEGLETQCKRVDNGKVRWLSIDLPEAIALREKFLKPTDRFKHLGQSAFELSWIDRIDSHSQVFVIAQGLFMYFEEKQIRHLLVEIFRRFEKVDLLFDFLSPSLVKKTQKGLQITSAYKLPSMAWGVRHDEIRKLLKAWLPEISIIRVDHYDVFARGLPHLILDRFLRKIPMIGDQLPGFVHLSNC